MAIAIEKPAYFRSKVISSQNRLEVDFLGKRMNEFHGSQSPIKLLRVSHCVIKSLIFLTWFNLSI